MKRFVMKRPGEKSVLVECEDFDDIRRKLIPDDPENGMVQAVPIMLDYWLLCDEEAKIKRNPPELNLITDMVVGQTILGNVMVILQDENGDWVSIPDVNVSNIMQWLDSQAKEVKGYV